MSLKKTKIQRILLKQHPSNWIKFEKTIWMYGYGYINSQFNRILLKYSFSDSKRLFILMKSGFLYGGMVYKQSNILRKRRPIVQGR